MWKPFLQLSVDDRWARQEGWHNQSRDLWAGFTLTHGGRLQRRMDGLSSSRAAVNPVTSCAAVTSAWRKSISADARRKRHRRACQSNAYGGFCRHQAGALTPPSRLSVRRRPGSMYPVLIASRNVSGCRVISVILQLNVYHATIALWKRCTTTVCWDFDFMWSHILQNPVTPYSVYGPKLQWNLL